MTATVTSPKARAYYRMAAAAHAKGNHELGNHWATRAEQVETDARHDAHLAPELSAENRNLSQAWSRNPA